MSRRATVVELSEDDRRTLVSWVRSGSTEQRLVVRVKIVLAAARGEATTKIASGLGIDPTTASKWRMRFAAAGVLGLSDAVRPGAPERYGEQTERRVLAVLDQPPPAGYGAWTGGLLAKGLGDVSADQVWRVLRRHGIHLMRRRSWCVSADPEFAAKAADIVGLYLAPPENTIVVCVDEKPHIQALERAQGWLRLPNGKTLTGFSHEYKRHGTTTLFGALEVATGQIKAGHYRRKRRREFLDFTNELVAGYPSEAELHVILDNLSTHKPKHDRWLKRHPNVHFHFTPTHASWLNQIEIWFSLLWRQALRGVSFTSPRQLRQAIDAYTAAYRQTAHPFECKKQLVHPTSLKHNLTDLRN
jgi:transposase